ncbi:hypothetical protein HPB48_016941 [Haemaphysalis longicornis]|uniref:Uncharacterized protein n=1 Tax=Haemaphysalis longicornis TaxID=44386 RepID=A0A9J6G1C2_HAELO|nr:hypothetical protein HPB48_016941 [Haemaphysalis longicornis]
MVRSVNGSVFIRGMDAASEGTYKCEVSADAPSFQTIFAEKMIRVDCECSLPAAAASLPAPAGASPFPYC